MASKQNNLTLEKRVTAKGLVNFRSIIYDPKQRSLRFEILVEPESDTVRDILLFEELIDFEETWHDRDGDCIDQLIGLDEVEDEAEGGKKFVIYTDQREINFSTKVEPKLTTLEA